MSNEPPSDSGQSRDDGSQGSVSRGYSPEGDSVSETRGDDAQARGPRDIRAAKVSIDHTEQGVTMTVTAGKLRLRLYIDAQWADLVQQISAGEGELDGLVPFRMAPFSLEDANVVSIKTINAHPIPGLSREDDLHDTSLWGGS